MPSSKSKKENKKKMNFWTCTLNSPLLLIVLFVVVLMNICCLWMNQDNETLFLFVLIAFLVHAQNKNMIIVLGVPLVITNILIVLRRHFRRPEGFAQNVEDFSLYEFQEWVKEYVLDDANMLNNSTYEDFTEQMNVYGSLFDVVDPILETATQMTSDDETTNKETVENLKNFLTLVYNLNESDELYDLDDAKYVRNMIDTYLEEMAEKNKDTTSEIMNEARNARENTTDAEEDAEEETAHNTMDEKLDGISSNVQELMSKLETLETSMD